MGPHATRMEESSFKYHLTKDSLLAMWCIPMQLTLLEAFTSPGVGEENLRGSEKREINLTIGDHLEYLIKLMKDKELPEAPLLAAKTVVNMLVNSEVLQALYC